MHKPSPVTPDPEACSIAAAISASAEGLRGRDLESALMEASMFGHLAYNALCNLGFEKLEQPKLTREENALVRWSMSQLLSMVDEAKAVFYAARAEERPST